MGERVFCNDKSLAKLKAPMASEVEVKFNLAESVANGLCRGPVDDPMQHELG